MLEKCKKLKKSYFSSIVKTEFSKKKLQKFLEKNFKKNIIIFSRKCKITQHFNCYEYDYIEKMCKNVKKCERCAKRHDTNRCSKDEIKITHKCVNCEQTKHQI